MVNVFLTGSTGYLGSTFLLHAPKNWNIFCFGRSRPPFPLPENAEWIPGDLRSEHATIIIPEETDTIIHLAGIKGSGACITNPSDAITTNIIGTHNLLQAAKNKEIQKIIFASTYWVYGETGRVPFEEAMALAPSDLYGLTKAVSEIEIQSSGIDYQILRFANVFGMGSGIRPEEVVYYFIRSASKGDAIRLEHGGYQEIDLIDVSDVCSVLRAAVENRTQSNVIINVGSGIPRSIQSIGHFIQEVFQNKYNRNVPIIFDHPDPVRTIRRFVSLKKFRIAFPDIKLKPFEEAVENYIDDVVGAR
jgi:nucleoside-diphosphate-sugar epimerase